MAIGSAIQAGLMLADQVRNGEARAQAEVERVKLLKAQADGQAATAALHRNQLEQAIAHQSRLAQAFLLQGQAPPPPGDVPQGADPGPQSRLRQELSPQPDVPPAPTYERGQPGIQPTPGQTGLQLFQPPPDEQQQLKDFAAKYGTPVAPQPGVQSSTPPAVVGPTPEPSRVPTGTTGTSRLSAQPSSPPGQSTGLPGAPDLAQAIPQGQGQPASPLQMPAASVTATGPDDTALLRNLSRITFMNNQPKEALAIFQYATEQQQLRDVGRIYREVLADPGANETQRRVALAGLGAAMMRAGKADESVKLLLSQLPLSSRQVIEQASVDTRNILLEQSQAGQPLDVAAANKEADKRAIARTNATREPAVQIVETESGVFSVDKKTGIATPVTITGTPGSRSGTSGTPQPLPGKRMTADQAKAYGYGTRALQANTILGELEAQGVTGSSFAAYMDQRGHPCKNLRFCPTRKPESAPTTGR